MARKPQVDVRRLKDEVAEHLKKGKFEKAAVTSYTKMSSNSTTANLTTF